MFIVENTYNNSREEYATLYEACAALRDFVASQWGSQEYDSLEEAEEERLEWQRVSKMVDGYYLRSQDGARHVTEPITVELPNGHTITLSEVEGG